MADGSTGTYTYAWRGGPRIYGSTDLELEKARDEARKRFRRERLKSIRPHVSKLPDTREEAIQHVCEKAVKNARDRAGRKGIKFSITHDDLIEVAHGQLWRCALSGIEFEPLYENRCDYTYNPFGISVDRIDNRRGYEKGNIRLVLTAVNFALNDWGEAIYIQIAKAVAAHRP